MASSNVNFFLDPKSKNPILDSIHTNGCVSWTKEVVSILIWKKKSERELEGDKETEKQRNRETHRHRDTERDRERVCVCVYDDNRLQFLFAEVLPTTII